MYEIRKVKTDMELLEEVLSKENLNKAYKRVYKYKGASGAWSPGFEEDIRRAGHHQISKEKFACYIKKTYLCIR